MQVLDRFRGIERVIVRQSSEACGRAGSLRLLRVLDQCSLVRISHSHDYGESTLGLLNADLDDPVPLIPVQAGKLARGPQNPESVYAACDHMLNKLGKSNLI
jgi:hypothetical protein